MGWRVNVTLFKIAAGDANISTCLRACVWHVQTFQHASMAALQLSVVVTQIESKGSWKLWHDRLGHVGLGRATPTFVE